MRSDPVAVLFDTSVLIDFLRKKPEARALLSDLAARRITLAISAVSVAELYAGMREHEEAETAKLIDALECLPLTARIAKKAGLIRGRQRQLGRTFALDDMMIGATAIVYGFPLVTDNRKDFEIPEIELFPSN
jgi:predicted nucleic acid-binding protein